jgi:hypothetical protein
MSLTYKQLADTRPADITIDTVKPTDIMFTDGEANGAIARLTYGSTSGIFVWPTGRIWVSGWAPCPPVISTWISTALLPVTNSGGASTNPVV